VLRGEHGSLAHAAPEQALHVGPYCGTGGGQASVFALRVRALILALAVGISPAPSSPVLYKALGDGRPCHHFGEQESPPRGDRCYARLFPLNSAVSNMFEHALRNWASSESIFGKLSRQKATRN
jgi:hypothetical protein